MPTNCGLKRGQEVRVWLVWLKNSVTLVVRNGNYRRTRSQIAGVIAGTDCDRVLPTIQIVSVARGLQLDAEGIAASPFTRSVAHAVGSTRTHP